MRNIKEQRNQAAENGEVFPYIPKIKGVNVTRLGGDKFYFKNQEFQTIKSMEGFLRLATTNLHLGTSKIRRTCNRRKASLPGRCWKPGTPVEIDHEDLWQNVVDKAIFQCTTALEVDFRQGYDPVENIKDNDYSPHKVGADHVVALLCADKELYTATKISLAVYGIGTLGGKALNQPKGVGQGTRTAVSKLFVQDILKAEWTPELVFTCDQYFTNIERCFQFSKIPFNIPEPEPLIIFEETYSSSAGYMELVQNQDMAVKEKFLSLQNDFVKIVDGLRPKKNQSAYVAVDRVIKFMNEAEEIFVNGGYPVDGFFGPNRSIIQKKNEILQLCDFHDFFDLEEGLYEHLDKFVDKLRLFWAEPQTKVILHRTVVTPGMELIKAGGQAQICAISCSVPNGSFSNLVVRLGLTNVEPRLKVILDRIYEKYPHWRRRVYSELDFSKYDSTIPAIILLLCSAFLCLFPYVTLEGENKMEQMLYYLSSVIITENAYKYAWVPYIAKMILFYGRIISGSFETSIMGTLVQLILRDLFFNMTIKKYLDEKDPEMAFKVLLCKWYVLVAALFGDDRTEGICEEMYPICGLHPFKDWLWDNFQILVKKIKPDEDRGESLTMFKSAVGEVHYKTVNGWPVLIRDVDSPSFLKTRVVDLYLDGEYLTRIHYRPTPHFGKIVSTFAADHPIKMLCSIVSAAWIYVGNLTVYKFLSVWYEKLVQFYGMSESQISAALSDAQELFGSDKSELRMLPNSIRRVIMEGVLAPGSGIAGFPEWSDIVGKHNINKRLRKKEPITYEEQARGYTYGYLEEEFIDLDDLLCSFADECDFYECAFDISL